MVTATHKFIPQQQKDRLKKVIKRTGDVLFVIMVALAVLLAGYMVYSRSTAKNTNVAGYQLFIVLSGSMSPTYDTGSLIFVKEIDPTLIQVGDVITYESTREGGKATTHRVVDIRTDGALRFITKGDANEAIDPYETMAQQVIGTVRFGIPYAGYVLEFAKTRQGSYLLIILPAITIIIFEIKKILGYLLKNNLTQSLFGSENDGEGIRAKVVEDPNEDPSEFYKFYKVIMEDEEKIQTTYGKQDAEVASMTEKKDTDNHVFDEDTQRIEFEMDHYEEQKEEDEDRLDNIEDLQEKLAAKQERIKVLSEQLRKKKQDEPDNQNSSNIEQQVMKIVGQAQMDAINRVLKAKREVAQNIERMKQTFGKKREEEKNLDHSVALLKQELRDTLNGSAANKGDESHDQ